MSGFHDDEAVAKMRYNNLGATGMRASVLSLGNYYMVLFEHDFYVLMQ